MSVIITPEAAKARAQYIREWRQKNADRVNAYNRAWRAKNPEKVREYQARYWNKRTAKQLQAERTTEE